MYVDEFIDKIKRENKVEFDKSLYFGLHVNPFATAVYRKNDNFQDVSYIGFINHRRNCFYVDKRHVYDEVFKFDDFADGWSFNDKGRQYMEDIVNGHVCRAFKSDTYLKKHIEYLYYNELIKGIERCVDCCTIKNVEFKDYYIWFSDMAKCLTKTKYEYISDGLVEIECLYNMGIKNDLHNLMFDLAADDNAVVSYVAQKLNSTDNFKHYEEGYVKGYKAYKMYDNLFKTPYASENLYYWVCLDICDAIKDLKDVTVTMLDGSRYCLENVVMSVDNTSYVAGYQGKHYRMCPFINIDEIKHDGIRVFSRGDTEGRLRDEKFLVALNDLRESNNRLIRDAVNGDLIFQDGLFGVVLEDEKSAIFSDGKKRVLYNYVLGDCSVKSLGFQKQKLEELRGGKQYGRER